MKPCLIAVLASLALPLTASAENQPSSAIPWLTESLSAPVTAKPDDPSLPVSDTIDAITVEVLSDQPRDGIGLLPAEMTGFPEDLWRGTSALRARNLIDATRYGGVPANRDLFRRILLAQTTPPGDDNEATNTLVARVDRLMEIGALQEAEALIEKAQPDTTDLFRRWFDIGLLTGRAAEACELLATSPMLSPSRSVQVFCLAQTSDWEAAATTLTLGEQLGQISKGEADLLHFYLDEGLIEEIDPPPPQTPFTSLEFLIRESVGLPRPNFPVPIAFMHVDLADFIPVRFRMEAGERLVRNGVLPSAVLFASYREESPAASGGIWERAAAVQAMDAAATGEEITAALSYLDKEMLRIGLRYAAAQEYLTYLSALPAAEMPPESHDTVAIYLMLAGADDVAGDWITPQSHPAIKAAHGIATETLAERHPMTKPFRTTTPEVFLNEEFADLIARGRSGEALLKVTDRLAQEARDEADLIEDIAALRSLGQEETARSVAVQMLLLSLDPSNADKLD